MTLPRRLLLAAPALVLLPPFARATPDAMAEAVRAFTGGSRSAISAARRCWPCA